MNLVSVTVMDRPVGTYRQKGGIKRLGVESEVRPMAKDLFSMRSEAIEGCRSDRKHKKNESRSNHDEVVTLPPPVSCCPAVLLSCCPAVLLSCCPAVLLSCCGIMCLSSFARMDG